MNEDELNKYRPLLMGLLDGELTPEEAADVNEALIRSRQLRDEYEAFQESDSKLNGVSFIEPTDVVAKRLWKSPYHRFARQAGIWFLIGGYAFLLLYSLLQATWSDGPFVTRFGVGAILLGIVVLLITFITERIQTHKADPYKEIER